MKLEFHPKLFIYLTLGFILATIIGTVSHEGGHYLVAKAFGYNPHLGYAYTSYASEQENKEIGDYYDTHREEMKDKNSPERKHFEELYKKYYPNRSEAIFVTLGGPVQTMLTGTIGLLFLWYNRKKVLNTGLTFTGWFFVLLSFFWSREVFNLLASIPAYLNGHGKNLRGDEPRLSVMLGWPSWSIGLVFAIAGAAVLMWVTFSFIPKHQRLTFILAGPAGAAIGWIL